MINGAYTDFQFAMNVARFIAFCGKLEYGRSGCIFAYISMTTRARDFKFAGTPVQRLQLAMVTLTQKSFSAQYAWFSRGGSHILLVLETRKAPASPFYASVWSLTVQFSNAIDTLAPPTPEVGVAPNS